MLPNIKDWDTIEFFDDTKYALFLHFYTLDISSCRSFYENHKICGISALITKDFYNNLLTLISITKKFL